MTRFPKINPQIHRADCIRRLVASSSEECDCVGHNSREMNWLALDEAEKLLDAIKKDARKGGARGEGATFSWIETDWQTRALESEDLLTAIRRDIEQIDRGTTHWYGCHQMHPRCRWLQAIVAYFEEQE